MLCSELSATVSIIAGLFINYSLSRIHCNASNKAVNFAAIIDILYVIPLYIPTSKSGILTAGDT